MKQPPATVPPAQQPAQARRRLAQAFSSLRQRNFRLYWLGQTISAVGTFMQGIGQAWLVLELTHSAFQLGVVGALQSLGVLLFSLFGGVAADRWPKRRIIVCTQTAAMLQAFALWALVATSTIQLWQLYVLATLLGLTSSLDRPTRQAFIVELVGRDDLPNAIALNSSAGNLARVLGPSLGGVIIAVSGVAALFLLNGASFLAVLLGLALIRSRELYAPTRRSAPQPAWESLREGLAYIWRTPNVALVIVVVGLALLFGSNFNVLLPLFATSVLQVGAQGFGFLSGAIAIGALGGALWLAWSSRAPTIRRVLLPALAFAALEAAFALSRSYPLSLGLIASVGFAETAFAALAVTLLQAAAPDHLSGRVVSVYILFFDGSVPLGYLLTGWLAATYGPSQALLVCAALTLLVVAGGWLWSRQIRRDQSSAASAASSAA